MRIALLVHSFPPARLGGTEVYSEAYARALVRAGHEVFVYAAEKDVARADLSTREGSTSQRDGITVTWITNNLFLGDFRETFDRPALVKPFEEFLDRAKPALLHAMHLIDVGASAPAAARRRAIPVGFTLHDYWLSCPRWGQRFHPDGAICEKIDLERCADCMTQFTWRQPKGAAGAARGFRWVRDNLGVDLATPAKKTLRTLRAKGVAAAPRGDAAELRARLEERVRFLREQAIDAVDLFLSPSKFLADEMVRFGIPKNRIVVSMLGIEKDWVSKVSRRPAPKTRVAFHGSLMRTKGAHVLLEAWGKLPADLRARASLTLRGAAREPAYVEELKRAAKRVGAVVEGEFPRSELAAKLSATDLLVVPSIWWENSPLSILEALAARVPLLVSDLGGMAELVREGRGGYRFRVGDAEDLARVLRECLETPGRLSECVAADAAVRSIDDDARELPRRILESTKQ